MRWVSSKESVAKGEVSVLATVETLCAIALVFYLSSHFNTLRWLAIAMCVAPLLLLRTEESTRLGVEWFDKCIERLSCHVWKFALLDGKWNSIKATVLFLFGTAISVFCIRISATAYGVIRWPVLTLTAIPKNWSRVALCLDSVSPPELIPEHPRATFDSVREGLRQKDDSVRFVSILIAPFFIPALLYRWSLKATSIIYAPLVFVAHSTFREGKDLRTRLELIKRGDLSRIRVWYGVIAIAAFLVKLLLMVNLPNFADWWNGHPVSRFLALYVAPAEIPKWQIAELLNSALAIGSMLFARHALLHYDLQHPWPEKPVKRILGFVSALRWLLALYAIVCLGYLTMRAAQHWHWPALGEKWIPWQ